MSFREKMTNFKALNKNCFFPDEKKSTNGKLPGGSPQKKTWLLEKISAFLCSQKMAQCLFGKSSKKVALRTIMIVFIKKKSTSHYHHERSYLKFPLPPGKTDKIVKAKKGQNTIQSNSFAVFSVWCEGNKKKRSKTYQRLGRGAK